MKHKELTEKIDSSSKQIKSPKTVEEERSNQHKQSNKTDQVETTVEEDRSSQNKLLNKSTRRCDLLSRYTYIVYDIALDVCSTVVSYLIYLLRLFFPLDLSSSTVCVDLICVHRMFLVTRFIFLIYLSSQSVCYCNFAVHIMFFLAKILSKSLAKIFAKTSAGTQKYDIYF